MCTSIVGSSSPLLDTYVFVFLGRRIGTFLPVLVSILHKCILGYTSRCASDFVTRCNCLLVDKLFHRLNWYDQKAHQSPRKSYSIIEFFTDDMTRVDSQDVIRVF